MIATAQLASLAGATVKGPDDEKIGKVVDVYESTDGSEGTFVTVSTGMFGGKASFVPLTNATMSGDDLQVPYAKDLIKDAPRLDTDEELTSQEEDRLYAHYSLSGVGSTGAATSGTTGATGAAMAPDTDRTPGATTSDTGAMPAADTMSGAGHDTSGPNTDDAMTVSEQRMNVGTRTQEAGRARLRKYVTTDTETRTVPVSHEEVVVEREPITDGNAGSAYDGPDISEEEHEVVLTEEVPVVATETVPVERVKLGTQTVTEDQTVSGDVSKEHIDLDGAADQSTVNR